MHLDDIALNRAESISIPPSSLHIANDTLKQSGSRISWQRTIPPSSLTVCNGLLEIWYICEDEGDKSQPYRTHNCMGGSDTHVSNLARSLRVMHTKDSTEL